MDAPGGLARHEDTRAADADSGTASAPPDPIGAPADAAPSIRDTPQLPDTVADGRPRQPDPRSVSLNRLVGWITAAVIAGPGLLFVTLHGLFRGDAWSIVLVLLWVAVAALLSWSAHAWPVIEHRHTSYVVDPQGIEIRRGVVWRRVIHVPRSRVQHTDVSQGPLERGHGLGTLVIYTAGTDHARVDLPGLDHGLALRIRDHLLPREHGDAV